MNAIQRLLTTKHLSIICVVLLVVACLIVGYEIYGRCSSKENYTASSLAHIGGLADYPPNVNMARLPTIASYPNTPIRRIPGDYDLMRTYGSQYNPYAPTPVYDYTGSTAVGGNSLDTMNSNQAITKEDFTMGLAKYPPMTTQIANPNANMPTYTPIGVTPPNLHKSANQKKTVDRLDRIDPSILPRTSSSVTPYNIDVADPTTYTFQVHAPRVIRKDKLSVLADPFRGDIPISIYPDVPLIGKSQYDRDSLRMDGFFSEAMAQRYDRLTGRNATNMPQYSSQGGTIMDQ